MSTSTSFDPFKVLGVPQDAGEDEIRARYLELVKKFPPEREPDKFREVQAAFQAAKDPLLIAERLIVPPSEDAPRWSDAIEEHKRIPPVLDPMLLVSLGNRDDAPETGDGEGESDRSEVGQDQTSDGDPSQKQHFIEQPHE